MSATECLLVAIAGCLAVILAPALVSGALRLRPCRPSGTWALFRLGLIVVTTDLGVALAAVRAFGA